MFIEYKGKTPKVHSTAFVAPTAVLIGDVEVGEQSSIWFGVVGRAGAVVRGAVDGAAAEPAAGAGTPDLVL